MPSCRIHRATFDCQSTVKLKFICTIRNPTLQHCHICTRRCYRDHRHCTGNCCNSRHNVCINSTLSPTRINLQKNKWKRKAAVVAVAVYLCPEEKCNFLTGCPLWPSDQHGTQQELNQSSPRLQQQLPTILFTQIHGASYLTREISRKKAG